MTLIAGADGCPGGWIVIPRHAGGLALEPRFVRALREVLEWELVPAVLCVDVPIGLLDAAAPGGRACDRAARRLLGGSRASSVFSPPVRPTLAAPSYEAACAANRASSPHGLGISRQCYGILEKIREVDELVTPELQRTVLEVHPEVSFHELNGERPLGASKRRPEGRAERLALLEQAFGQELGAHVEERPARSNPDDVLDALAACWTAGRVLDGDARRLPHEPPRDSRGLRMEIVR